MEYESHTSWLSREYTRLSVLFSAQPEETRRFLRLQAEEIVTALRTDRRQIAFSLPNQIILEGGDYLDMSHAPLRRLVRGGWFSFGHTGSFDRLRHHLDALEVSVNPALSLCGSLVKYSLAQQILQEPVPGGHKEQHRPGSEEVDASIAVESVIPSGVLATVNAGGHTGHEPPGLFKSQVSYAPASHGSLPPQWIADREDEQESIHSPQEAESTLALLQQSFHMTQAAEALLPCVIVDEAYQKKRARITVQLVNHGSNLACYYASQIIRKIRSRAANGSLNRGLQLSLPYFDHRELSLKLHNFEVIPEGRIVFLDAFVVRAMQQEKNRVGADIRFDPATRRHLMGLLDHLEKDFTHPSSKG